jgi:hypothetical protein
VNVSDVSDAGTEATMAHTASPATHSSVVPDAALDRRPALRSALPLLATMIATLVLAIAVIALTAAQSPVIVEVSAGLVA